TMPVNMKLILTSLAALASLAGSWSRGRPRPRLREQRAMRLHARFARGAEQWLRPYTSNAPTQGTPTLAPPLHHPLLPVRIAQVSLNRNVLAELLHPHIRDA